jgi:tetratricopeptide (TPR) repeat protein
MKDYINYIIYPNAKSYLFRWITTSILLGVLILLSQSDLRAQTDSSLATILARAYSMLQVNSPDAEILFEKATAMDPSNVSVRKQLGYIYNSNKKYDMALQQYTIADSLSPSDTTKLNMAHALVLLNRKKEAKSIVRQLQKSSSPDIRNRVASQFPESFLSSPSVWWTRIYLAPYYDTRWKTSFYYANLQQGYYLTDDRIFSAYSFLSMSGDVRSKGGLSPVIFSDNAVIVGIGLNTKPFTGFQFNLQQGVAFDLIKRRTRASVMGDFRAVAIYGNGIYPSFSLHNDMQFPLSFLADVYSSLGYYSRYKNCIWYLQVKTGLRMIEISNSVMDLYLKGALVRDTEKEYYNNQLEGAIGFRIIPDIRWGLYLIGEFNRGYYWNVGTTRNPYDNYYNSFRFFIIYDRTF